MYRPVQTQQINSVKPIFFSQKNFDTLESVLIQEFEKRNHSPLNDQQIKRLEKTIEHYLNEVYTVQGEKPIQVLNKEVLSSSLQDFSKYLQRKEVVQNKQSAVKNVMDEGLFQETAQRFERLTQERNETKALPPAVPDFRIAINEDGPTSVQLYEMAKKQREVDALRNNQGISDMPKTDPSIQKFVNADSMFRAQQDSLSRSTEMALFERQNRPREFASDAPLMVLPDRRELMLAPLGTFDTMTQSPMPRELGNANSNPTIVQPEFASPAKVDLGQNYVVREERTVSYKEIENNLIIYSADRDWLKNNKENRYNFTVNFDPAINGQSFGPSPAVQEKFKNIVRIEFVKAIMPGEGIDVRVKCDVSGASTSYQDNILSFPYVTLRVAELENNNYGTDNFLDRSFGVLQYDANWISDTTSTDTRGYIAMIPKFLKCEKVYHPTPLSTLQKMTIDIHRPNGELISDSPDTYDIAGILAGSWTGGGTSPYNITLAPSIYKATATGYLGSTSATGSCNFFINTSTYFSRFQITPGDRIQISGYTYSQTVLDANPGLMDFVNWINNSEGHIVLAIGNTNSAGTYSDGPNNVGYANFIIIQGRYQDPTTGSTNLSLFGPIVAGADTIGTVLSNNVSYLDFPRRLIDLNKQISLVFRVITREMDALPQLRPDNNY